MDMSILRIREYIWLCTIGLDQWLHRASPCSEKSCLGEKEIVGEGTIEGEKEEEECTRESVKQQQQ